MVLCELQSAECSLMMTRLTICPALCLFMLQKSIFSLISLAYKIS